MPRPLKYIEGPPIRSMEEFAQHIEAGGYFIQLWTKQRIHPGWAASWHFRDCLRAVRGGSLLRAVPNPDHPDNQNKIPF